MPQFQLNTSGAVVAPIGSHNANTGPLAWASLDAFTQGYIEALFFTEEEQLCEESDGARNMPDVAINTATMESHFVGGDSFGFSDLAPGALARIIADCEAFQRVNAAALAEAYARDYDAEQAGRDYWFTRNGHGVGFWDRDALEPDSAEYEEATAAIVAACHDSVAWGRAVDARNVLKAESLGERLSAACRYQGVDAYLGDDGKVHLS
ncbi:hypothetical protein [Brevundimonas sp. CEF1]|uniref:hypothetical protein n=1 Tax=Brevundimonas sp. CEF1 TaxID=3442642 RepID=UPI003F519B17